MSESSGIIFHFKNGSIKFVDGADIESFTNFMTKVDLRLKPFIVINGNVSINMKEVTYFENYNSKKEDQL